MASKLPPLNGRNLAEFYCASETRKRTVLRAYAKPVEQQKARIILYDPIRRILLEYFRSGQDASVLERLKATLTNRDFSNAAYAETWYRFNRAAAASLANLAFGGHFEHVTPARSQIKIGALEVRSTADFSATFVPVGRARPKRVAVVVNPSGIKAGSEEKRDVWMAIEAEVAWRAASPADLNGILYVDLSREQVSFMKVPKKRIWAEIEATCERIYRDWRDIRLERDDELSVG